MKRLSWHGSFPDGEFKVQRASVERPELDFFTHFKGEEPFSFTIKNWTTENTLRLRRSAARWTVEVVCGDGKTVLANGVQRDFLRKKMLFALRTHPLNSDKRLSAFFRKAFRRL